MAIIVDKEAKRRDIALSCRDLLQENGIGNLTVAQIAQAAGVGKGTIYEYFDNKEDIVFEIITTFLDEDLKYLQELVTLPLSTREKLLRFCTFRHENEQEGEKYQELFREFLAISLISKDPAMLRFSQEARAAFRIILEQILDEGVARGELEERFRGAAESLIIFSTGMVVESRLEGFDTQQELNTILDLFFPTPTQGNPS